MDGVKERFMETSEEFENARRRARTAKTTFERIRKRRYDTFMHCFDHVSTKIDEVYKVRLSHFIVIPNVLSTFVYVSNF